MKHILSAILVASIASVSNAQITGTATTHNGITTYSFSDGSRGTSTTHNGITSYSFSGPNNSVRSEMDRMQRNHNERMWQQQQVAAQQQAYIQQQANAQQWMYYNNSVSAKSIVDANMERARQKRAREKAARDARLKKQ